MTGTILVVVAGVIVLFLLYSERGLWPRPSTREIMKNQGLKNLLNFKAFHAYIYMRWTRQYIGTVLNRMLPRSTERARRKWAERYHAKILTHDHACAIITLDRNIPFRDLEQVIPYPAARDLVLSGPPDVAAYDCVCRLARANHCRPVQVCMIIGKPFTDFILEHHPGKSRRLLQQEALDLLKQEHERGHLHTAFFRDVMLNRFYAICNCCKCCCGSLEAMTRYNAPMFAPSGYVAAADTSLCDGCGACERACPFGAVRINGTAAVKWERCMGCGVCTRQCPNAALSLVRDEKKGTPFDVRMMA